MIIFTDFLILFTYFVSGLSAWLFSFIFQLVCENVIICCQNVISGYKQLNQKDIAEIFCILVGCHKAFDVFGARFRNFSDIVYVFPECSEIVSKYKKDTKVAKDGSGEKRMAYLLTDDEIVRFIYLNFENLKSLYGLGKRVKAIPNSSSIRSRD